MRTKLDTWKRQQTKAMNRRLTVRKRNLHRAISYGNITSRYSTRGTLTPNIRPEYGIMMNIAMMMAKGSKDKTIKQQGQRGA